MVLEKLFQGENLPIICAASIIVFSLIFEAATALGGKDERPLMSQRERGSRPFTLPF